MWVLIQALCCGFESRVDFSFIIFLTYFFSTSRVRIRVRVRIRIRIRIWVGVILSLKKIHGQVLVTRCSSGSEIALTSKARFVLLNSRTRQMPHPKISKATASSHDVTIRKGSPSSNAITVFKLKAPGYKAAV